MKLTLLIALTLLQLVPSLSHALPSPGYPTSRSDGFGQEDNYDPTGTAPTSPMRKDTDDEKKKTAEAGQGSGTNDESAGNNIPVPETSSEAVGAEAAGVPSLSPMAGTVDVLNSQAYVDMSAAALNSKLGLLNMTWNLTEPGVAQGMHNSMMQSNDAVLLRYLSQQNLQLRSKNSPALMAVAQSVANCIDMLTAAGKSWIEADSRCNGGDKVRGESNFAMPQNQQTADLNPNPIGSTDGSATSEDRNTVLATDYVFGQEIRRLMSSGENQAAGIKLPRLLAIKAEIAAFIGDAKFKLARAGVTGAKVIQVEEIPPKPPADVTDPIIGGNWNDSQMRYYIFSKRYVELHELLGLYCYWYTRECAGGTCAANGASDRDKLLKAQYPSITSTINQSNNSGDVVDFWRDSKKAQRLVAQLSVPGFALKQVVVEALFDMYKADEGKFESQSDRAGELYGACDKLNARPGQPSSLDVLFGNTATANATIVNNGSLADKTPRQRAIIQIARMSAEGDYLAVLARAQNYIKKYSFGGDGASNWGHGSMEAEARDYLLGRIEMAGKAKDVEAALQANAKNYQDYTTTILRDKKIRLDSSAAINQGTLQNAGDSNKNQTDVTK